MTDTPNETTIITDFADFIRRDVLTGIPRILIGVVAVVVGIFVIKLLMRWEKKLLKKTKLDASIHALIVTVSRIFLLVLLAIAFLDIIGVSAASLITAIGAVVIAVALAVKENMAALAGGVVILVAKPFVANDYVQIGDFEPGTVESVQLLSTHLVTFDNKLVVIPNSLISQRAIVNYTRMPVRRVDITLPLAYDADFNKAADVLKGIAEKHPLVLSDPPCTVRIDKSARAAVILTFRPWVKPENYWEVYHGLQELAHEELLKQGFKAPALRVERHPSEK